MANLMYSLSAPVFVRTLRNLDGVLDKGAAYATARKIEAITTAPNSIKNSMRSCQTRKNSAAMPRTMKTRRTKMRSFGPPCFVPMLAPVQAAVKSAYPTLLFRPGND